MKRRSRFSTAPMVGLLMLVAGFVAEPGWAQDYNVRSFQGHTPSTDELIEGLKPEAPAVRTRGLRPVEASKPKAVSLMVQFEFGSAQLSPDAKQVLDNLGAALKSPQLGGDKFLIEGHTDAVGSEEYNQRLSDARARSVKEYLTTHGVEPDRLGTVGRGENSLLDKTDPGAALNRRVQVINLR